MLPHNSAWQPFTKSRTVNLPDALFEEYNCKSSINGGPLAESLTHWYHSTRMQVLYGSVP